MSNIQKFRIALIGPHSKSFVKALHADDRFEVARTCSSIASAIEQKVDALSLAGHGHALREADVNEMLNNGTALALFQPQASLLETIHKATKTPIDIPSLSLHQDLPLLVYVVDNVVHIAPNNHSIERRAHKAVNEADVGADSVRSIYRATSAYHAIMAFVSTMDPPIGVIGFKRGTIDHSTTISITTLSWAEDGTYNVETSDDSLIQRYDFNWYTDYYAYATGTDCRDKTASEFTEKGGVVHVVAVDHGNIVRASDSAPRYHGPTAGFCSYYFVDYNKTGVHGDESMTLKAYQPRTLTSTQDKKNTYGIEYRQDMQMLKSGGNETVTFSAQYTIDLTLDRFQQHALPSSRGVDYLLTYKDYYDLWADPEFKSRTWFDLGVFEWVDRDGWEHIIVRPDLPEDNLPITNLTTFTSSLGKPTMTFKRDTVFRAFKSNAWRTTSDDDTTHKQRDHQSYGDETQYTLDLTWSSVPSEEE
ncbi:hypothetical protein ONZ45_g17130 [Pleurotus djamor]|nr:hypothetical protein ONZ45_g17130 [Pleurotus djamor]